VKQIQSLINKLFSPYQSILVFVILILETIVSVFHMELVLTKCGP